MLVAVYGSLREGDCNHPKLGFDPKFVFQERLSGFQMYNVGGLFPYVTPEEGSILAEMYEITPEAFDRCDHMEVGSGYTRSQVDTSVGKAYIWIMTVGSHRRQQIGSRYPKILSGDWFEWLRKYKPERLSR